MDQIACEKVHCSPGLFHLSLPACRASHCSVISFQFATYLSRSIRPTESQPHQMERSNRTWTTCFPIDLPVGVGRKIPNARPANAARLSLFVASGVSRFARTARISRGRQSSSSRHPCCTRRCASAQSSRIPARFFRLCCASYLLAKLLAAINKGKYRGWLSAGRGERRVKDEEK